MRREELSASPFKNAADQTAPEGDRQRIRRIAPPLSAPNPRKDGALRRLDGTPFSLEHCRVASSPPSAEVAVILPRLPANPRTERDR